MAHSAGVEPKLTFSQKEAGYPTERMSQLCHTKRLEKSTELYRRDDIINTPINLIV